MMLIALTTKMQDKNVAECFSPLLSFISKSTS